jgi:hypothetical protein
MRADASLIERQAPESKHFRPIRGRGLVREALAEKRPADGIQGNQGGNSAEYALDLLT